MSWSVSAVGKPHAVLEKIVTQFDGMTPCDGVEEDVRQNIKGIIMKALEAYPKSGRAVRVEAHGSQSDPHWGSADQGKHVVNTLSVRIEELYGFVE